MPVPGATCPLPPVPPQLWARALADAVDRCDAILAQGGPDAGFLARVQRDRDQLQLQLDDTMGRIENLIWVHETAPEAARKDWMYGEGAFYRRSGGGMTVASQGQAVAQLGPPSIASERARFAEERR